MSATEIKTIFCDIDGCILKHHGSIKAMHDLGTNDVLPGVQEANAKWVHKGYTIILTTGRKESMREITMQQLDKIGFHYDALIMGLPRGARVIINDQKPGRESPVAVVVSLPRNKGMENVDI
jgi:hypothetical protein